MTFQFGQDLEMDQLRTDHNISKILTTPSEKRGRALTKRDDKGGIAGFSIVLDQLSYHPSCNTSLILRQARRRNILNTSNRFVPQLFPMFDTCLSYNQLNLQGGIKNGN